MKAAVIERYGGSSVVEIWEVPRPLPGPGEVLIRVRAASVNPLDWKIRRGDLRLITGRSFPKVLGNECAGQVEETGPGAHRFGIGERVVAFAGPRRMGAFANWLCVEEKKIFPLPEGVSYEEGATLPIAGLTALQALRDRGHLSEGGRVLINGASGGVGTFAVQIARLLGARVTGVCSTENLDRVRELGAHEVIDYTRNDFTRGNERYDLIFDAVSKAPFSRARGVLAPCGIYVATLPSLPVLLNRFFTGIFSDRKARLIMVRPHAADMEWMTGRLQEGTIRVVIDRRYPLKRTAEALAFSESGKARGKIVLTMDRTG